MLAGGIGGCSESPAPSKIAGLAVRGKLRLLRGAGIAILGTPRDAGSTPLSLRGGNHGKSGCRQGPHRMSSHGSGESRRRTIRGQQTTHARFLAAQRCAQRLHPKSIVFVGQKVGNRYGKIETRMIGDRRAVGRAQAIGLSIGGQVRIECLQPYISPRALGVGRRATNVTTRVAGAEAITNPVPRTVSVCPGLLP